LAASTEATVPVTSTIGVAAGAVDAVADVPAPGLGVEAVPAFPVTSMLFSTVLTPLTPEAICAARARRSGESTVPASVTTPASDFTSILVRFESFSAVSFALTSATIAASSMICPIVRPPANDAFVPPSWNCGLPAGGVTAGR